MLTSHERLGILNMSKTRFNVNIKQKVGFV